MLKLESAETRRVLVPIAKQAATAGNRAVPVNPVFLRPPCGFDLGRLYLVTAAPFNAAANGASQIALAKPGYREGGTRRVGIRLRWLTALKTWPNADLTARTRSNASSGSQYELAVLGHAQTVVTTLMLDDDLAAHAEKLERSDPPHQLRVRPQGPLRGFVCTKSFLHDQIIMIRILGGQAFLSFFLRAAPRRTEMAGAG